MELGAGEIVVILAIVLLLFGPSKLPKLGEGLGSALANFRKGMRGDDAPAAPAADRRAPAGPPIAPPATEAAPDGASRP